MYRSAWSPPPLTTGKLETTRKPAIAKGNRRLQAHQLLQLLISSIRIVLFGNRTKVVLAAMRQIDDLILKSGPLYFSLKVAER